jgi:glycolate oxidase FAD binding subunit
MRGIGSDYAYGFVLTFSSLRGAGEETDITVQPSWGRRMNGILKPQSENDICNAVREAAESGASFEIMGRGTKRGFGRCTDTHGLLDISALSGILSYEPEELVIHLRAATPMAEIEAALAEHNQMLGFEPADWGPLFGTDAGHATMAGVTSANACGARRVKAGAVRDHVIGCRFVNGEGEAIKAGGPVIKNVTGFDVTRLMCGAFGTLGVLTELTLRVTPKPERIAALTIACPAQDGLRILRDAAQLPLDPTGLAYIPGQDGTLEGMAAIRVEGSRAAVGDKLIELQGRFAAEDAHTADSMAAHNIFRDVSDGTVLRDTTSDLWRLCVTPSSAYEALVESGVQNTSWYADWAGGLLWLGLPATPEVSARLRAIAGRLGGHATLMRASPEKRAALDVFEPETPTRAMLTHRVKQAFDPKAVFNPGRMYKGI